MFGFAHGLVALLVTSPLVAAVRLSDGTYKFSYSAAGCGVGMQHYLDLTGPKVNATFNPLDVSQAQTDSWRVTPATQWTVSTSGLDNTWRQFTSIKHADAILRFPNQRQGTRIRGAIGDDSTYFNMVDTELPDCYYVYPFASSDVGFNGDTELRKKNRFAYLRGPITRYPVPIYPLKFTKVK
ncbi:hypothetical protein B0J17DRAFT_634842 [Rhizoctonia solani]|nr:hypothetical protein B0J17DRAFT_634842 [Rhizoctonia solani]